jgi:hypothetical protein
VNKPSKDEVVGTVLGAIAALIIAYYSYRNWFWKKGPR